MNGNSLMKEPYFSNYKYISQDVGNPQGNGIIRGEKDLEFTGR